MTKHDYMGMFKTKGDGDMNNLKKARISKGYTQKFVADNAGIATRAYVRYESEKENRHPEIRTAIRIADVLGIYDLRKIWDSNLEA